MKSNMKNYVSLWEMQDAAVGLLPGLAKDYYQSGSEDEYALRENERMYRELRLRYRVLQKMGDVDTSTTLFGREIAFPLYVAPAAFQCMAHSEGEIANARAAADRGVGFCLSTLATQPMEEVAAETQGRIPLWFQLYMYKDQGRTRELLQRAKNSGYQAIALTVDAPAWGKREVDIHNGFHLPHGMWIRNVDPDGTETLPEGDGSSGLSDYIGTRFHTVLGWDDIDWIRNEVDLPIIIKGVHHPEDVRLAVEHGVDGVWVSNHGGRQLDTSTATVAALPDCVEAADGKLPIVVDGGIRRGTDILKALALGANAVAVGRPALWGLAVGGAQGVSRMLEILGDEFRTAMKLVGAKKVSDLKPEMVVHSGWPFAGR